MTIMISAEATRTKVVIHPNGTESFFSFASVETISLGKRGHRNQGDDYSL